MSFEGVIVNGQVELDEPAEMPDGTRVRVEPLAAPTAASPTGKAAVWRETARKERAGKPPSALAEILRSMAGTVKDLPEDFAAQHDHYIHETPKR